MDRRHTKLFAERRETDSIEEPEKRTTVERGRRKGTYDEREETE